MASLITAELIDSLRVRKFYRNRLLPAEISLQAVIVIPVTDILRNEQFQFRTKS